MNTFKKFGRSIGLVFAYIAISVLLQVFYLALGIDDEIVTTFILIFSSAFSAGFVIYKLRDKLKGEFADFKKNARKYLKIAFKNWFVGFVLMIIINAVLINLLGNIAPNEEANREMMDSYLLYSVIYSCVIAPVAEELLFRLNFADVFKNKRTFTWMTAFLFGALHLVGNVAVPTDILYILPYAVLGYYFSATYVETDNIYASIAAHAFHNILATAIALSGI